MYIYSAYIYTDSIYVRLYLPICLYAEIQTTIEAHLVLVYTGTTRLAKHLLQVLYIYIVYIYTYIIYVSLYMPICLYTGDSGDD